MISNKLIYVSWILKNLVFFLGIDLFFGVGKIFGDLKLKKEESTGFRELDIRKKTERETVEIVEAKTLIPGLVNSPKKRMGKIHHAIFMGSYPLFRLGHVQVRKL